MNTITYKGKEYPTRTFTVLFEEEEHTYTVSVDSLFTAFGDEWDIMGSEAQKVDNEIYFYVPDDVIDLSAFEICDKHLDEQMVLIKDEDDEEDYSNRSCATCSLGQSGKCELKLEKKCISNTNNEKNKDYWIDKDEE